MTTFFTSDLHFGHANIIKFCDRPFDNVSHMHEELIRKWNETVNEDDTVYILGDIAMGVRTETIPILARLNGALKLIAGNHD